MRLLTYRNLRGEVQFIKDRTFLRIGKGNSAVDNMCSGGGAVAVDSLGRIGDRLFRHKVCSTEPFLFAGSDVPNFDRAVQMVCKMHEHLYYMDWVGWDVGLDENDEPVFVELNWGPDPWATEPVCGPMFGSWLDEVAERISAVKKIKVEAEVKVFDECHDHLMQTGGPAYELR